MVKFFLANSCCYINVRILAKFRYNPCKYWCFGVFFFKNACVWLQWLGFEGKHAMLCIRGLPGPHKGHACFPTISHQKFTKSVFFNIFTIHHLLNLCILQALCSYIWEISLFSLQKWFWGYFAKGIWQNFTYFPKNRMCYICVLLNHCIKLKFYAFCRVCFSKLCLLWHFHSKMSNSMLHVMPSIYVQ